jgi:L-asparagine transporter-like permease
MLAALLLEMRFQQTAYVYMLGAAFFGGLYVWMMIFVTHLVFRRREPAGAMRLAPPGPWSSLVGFFALAAVLVSTWWIPRMRITLAAGIPWLAFISLCYLVRAKFRFARRT